ncbi:NAD(+) diphosphatase [Alkalilacustris brevis]|uniref:NAD(+) diphosphatase n=1 Tax=Alkalilacustris brevis TaxID=2026338 RepID=UPI000E0D19BD|nr:NAD(+) diphosphatase [Alkalilacustris brevis]
MREAGKVTFAGAGRDRAGHLRSDPSAMARLQAAAGARLLVLWRGKPLIAGAGRDRIGWLAPGHALAGLAGAPQVFLGFCTDGAPCFAIDISSWQPPDLDAAALAAFSDPTEQHHPGLPSDHRFTELRQVMTRLPPEEAELAATARALFGWHLSHRFCSACGAASEMVEAGWRRTCPACGTHHFPRSDPVVIMLVVRGNRLLLGRAPGWPEGMYSLLAGFVEPGETIEAAVRREVAEETGVRVGRVDYLASQPWPFPASLMLGCVAQAETGTITRDETELDDALWLTREELVEVIAGAHPRIKGARRGAIAHFLIRHWLADRLA